LAWCRWAPSRKTEAVDLSIKRVALALDDRAESRPPRPLDPCAPVMDDVATLAERLAAWTPGCIHGGTNGSTPCRRLFDGRVGRATNVDRVPTGDQLPCATPEC